MLVCMMTLPFQPNAVVIALDDVGADDLKPLEPKLPEEVKALLHNGQAFLAVVTLTPETNGQMPGQVVGFDTHLLVDEARVIAAVNGKTLELTPSEFKMLACLVHAEGRAVSREELHGVTQGEHGSLSLRRAVDGHIKNLRHKLRALNAEAVIETVRGIGYRLNHQVVIETQLRSD